MDRPHLISFKICLILITYLLAKILSHKWIFIMQTVIAFSKFHLLLSTYIMIQGIGQGSELLYRLIVIRRLQEYG